MKISELKWEFFAAIAAIVFAIMFCWNIGAHGQGLGPFANIGDTLDATETQQFRRLIDIARDTADAGDNLGDSILMSVLNEDELPSGTGTLPIGTAIQNRIFDPSRTNSMVSKICFMIAYHEARTRQTISHRWVRRVALRSATDEIEDATIREVFLFRVKDLDEDLPNRDKLKEGVEKRR